MINLDINDFTSESYANIRYILTSDLRTKIMLILYESDKSFEEIQRILNKQKSNLLRTLRELEEKMLVSINRKIYSLTSTGYIATAGVKYFIETWYNLRENNEFWNNHSLKNVPLEFYRYMYVWNNAETVTSSGLEIYKTIGFFIEHVRNSKDILVFLPIFSISHINALFNALENNNGKLYLLTSQTIYDTIKRSPVNEEFEELRKNKKIKLWLTKDNEMINMFLTCTQEFSIMSLYYNDGTFDQNTLLYTESKDNVLDIYNLMRDYLTSFEEVKLDNN